MGEGEFRPLATNEVVIRSKVTTRRMIDALQKETPTARYSPVTKRIRAEKKPRLALFEIVKAAGKKIFRKR